MPLPLLLLAAAASIPSATADRAAVTEAENHWSAAEVGGDTAFLQGFLTDDYESVSANGVAYRKADLIAGAARRAKEHPGMVATPMPPSSTIQLDGDTAIVRHHSATHVSVDVLQKRHGKWMAWFSQHTDLPKAPA